MILIPAQTPLVAKKKSRKSRLEDLTSELLQERSDDLAHRAGQLKALADQIEASGVENIRVDGAGYYSRALSEIDAYIGAIKKAMVDADIL